MSFTEINVTVQLRCSLGEVDEAREGGNEYYIRDVVDFFMLTNNWTRTFVDDGKSYNRHVCIISIAFGAWTQSLVVSRGTVKCGTIYLYEDVDFHSNMASSDDFLSLYYLKKMNNVL